MCKCAPPSTLMLLVCLMIWLPAINLLAAPKMHPSLDSGPHLVRCPARSALGCMIIYVPSWSGSGVTALPIVRTSALASPLWRRRLFSRAKKTFVAIRICTVLLFVQHDPLYC